MKTLDLGCGKKKYHGSIGIDISSETDADIIHDLNVFPYPFEDNKFDWIVCDNTLEHLDNVISVMEEIWRIAENDATIKIRVPYFRSVYAAIDPTHKHLFTYNSFNYFDDSHPFSKLYKYTSCRFKIDRIYFDKTISRGILHRLIKFIANRKPQFYEIHISHLFPLNELTFYLKTQK